MMKVLFGGPAVPGASVNRPKTPAAAPQFAGLNADTVTIRFRGKDEEDDQDPKGAPEKATEAEPAAKGTHHSPDRAQAAVSDDEGDEAPTPGSQVLSGLSPQQIQALARDAALVEQVKSFAQSVQTVFVKQVQKLAANPVLLAAVTGQKPVSEQELAAIQQDIDQQLVDFLNQRAEAAAGSNLARQEEILNGRDLSQLSPDEQLELARQEVVFAIQMRVLQQLAQVRGNLFQQALQAAVGQARAGGPAQGADEAEEAGGLSQEDFEAIREEVSQEPAFQAEVEAYAREFEEAFKKTALALISDPEWVNATLGLKPLSEAEYKAKVDNINKTMGAFMERTQQALQAYFNEEIVRIIGPEKDPAQARISSLAPEQQRAVIRLQAMMAARGEVLQNFDASSAFQKLENDFFKDKKEAVWAPVQAQLDALADGSPAVDRLLARTRSDNEEVRYNAIDQLIAYLAAEPNRTGDQLAAIIRAAAQVPSEEVKVHAAEAIMMVPDDGEKKALMSEWLNSENTNNKLAVLKLFTFTQGNNNMGISVKAYELRDADPDLKALIEAQRANPHPQVQFMLGLVDKHDALEVDRADKAERANARTRNRVFAPPKHE